MQQAAEARLQQGLATLPEVIANGGKLPARSLDVFSARPAKYSLWRAVTRLNERHMLFAWISLIWVGLTDVYVRLLSMGVIRDVRFF